MYRLRVREVAQQRGFDQSKLARKGELAFKTVQRLWHHPYTDAQLSTLARMAEAMNVKFTDLIEDAPKEKPEA